MTAIFTAVLLCYLAAAAVSAVLAALGVPCGPAAITGLVVAELLLLINVVLDVTILLGGHRPHDLPTHVGYLITSVVLLPLALVLAPRPPPGMPELRREQARYAVIAFSCAVAAVVVIRQRQTLA